MNRITAKINRYTRRKRGIRKSIFGSPSRPRLTVRRSSKNIYAQLIDDTSGQTICSASTIEKDGKVDAGSNCSAAKEIGTRIAAKAMDFIKKQCGSTIVLFNPFFTLFDDTPYILNADHRCVKCFYVPA